MIVTPYHHPPRSEFLKRMIFPSLGVFLIGFLMIGIYLDSMESQVSRGVVEGGSYYFKTLIDAWFHIPEVCYPGGAVNDYQREQCTKFWDLLWWETAVASIPFGAVALFLMMGLDILVSLYRRVRKKIEAHETVVTGVVTRPSLLPRDFFCWFYCFYLVSVELESGHQEKVYLPVSLPAPLHGQKLTVFNLGKLWGEERRVGIPFAPHVVILKGAR